MEEEITKSEHKGMLGSAEEYERIFTDSEEEIRKEDEANAAFFRKQGKAALIFAVIITFALYKNYGTIMSVVAAAAAIGYFIYSTKVFGKRIDAISWGYAALIMLLGISDFLTGNVMFQRFNELGMILLYAAMLLHVFCNDKKWTLIKYVEAGIEAGIGIISKVFSLFTDFASSRRVGKNEKASKVIFVILGLVIALPMLLIITGLLASADEVFGGIVEGILSFVIPDFDNIGIIFTFVFYLITAYAGMRYLSSNKISDEVTDLRNAEPIFAITVLSPIGFVYLIFSAIQIYYLFLGGNLPEGISYANYAREGFFQLLAVCFINVFMVLFVQAFFKENLVTKIIMTIISACTYVMIMSSAYRMLLYIRSYNLTELRVMVLWALLLLAVLFVGIIIQIFKRNFPLFKYSVVVVAVLYIVLSFARIDYHIARYNLKNLEYENGVVDYGYLSHLSSDAASVIDEYDGYWVDRYFMRLSSEEQGFRNFNLSIYKSQNLKHIPSGTKKR